MCDEVLPPWLPDAVEDAPGASRDPSFKEADPAEVMAGDICVVRPIASAGRLPRLIVVSSVGEGWCEGMLAGPETELATEVDALLNPIISGLGYEIAVYTRFSGPVWIAQVSRRVGAVEDQVLEQLQVLAWSDEPEGVTLARGIPLQPRGIDPRYPALASMSVELDGLTDHCRRRRSELGAPILDPAIGKPDVLHALAAEPFALVEAEEMDVPWEFCQELLSSFPALGRDEQRALQPLLERALTSRPFPATWGSPGEIFGHRGGETLASVVAETANPVPLITVLTHQKCWTALSHTATRLVTQRGQTLVIFASLTGIRLREAA
jgi:hypothetical protein